MVKILLNSDDEHAIEEGKGCFEEGVMSKKDWQNQEEKSDGLLHRCNPMYSLEQRSNQLEALPVDLTVHAWQLVAASSQLQYCSVLMIIICNLYCWLPISKVSGEASKRLQKVIMSAGHSTLHRIHLIMSTGTAWTAILSWYSQMISHLTPMLLNDRVPHLNHCWSDISACELRCPTYLMKETPNSLYFYTIKR